MNPKENGLSIWYTGKCVNPRAIHCELSTNTVVSSLSFSPPRVFLLFTVPGWISHILDRRLGDNGNYVYDVSLLFYKDNLEPFTPKEYEYDKTELRENLYVRYWWRPEPLYPVYDALHQRTSCLIFFVCSQVDFNVPRSAIRWSEKPYLDDEHLENAFRYPIGFPADLVPQAWEV